MKKFDPNNYESQDLSAAFANAVLMAFFAYNAIKFLTSKNERLLEEQKQEKEESFQRMEHAILIKESVMNRIIPENEGCRILKEELNFDPNFLTTGEFHELPSTDMEKPVSSPPPFSSISLLNPSERQFNTRKPRKHVEYHQVAEVSSRPIPGYKSRLEGISTEGLICGVSMLFGLVSGVIYLRVLGKLRKLSWYQDSVTKHNNLVDQVKKVETDQKQILETQKKIIELLSNKKV